MDPRVTLSIIIVNYNTCDITSACIESIYSSLISVPFEIILVDNASSEKTNSLFQDKFPHLQIIKNEQNVGFGRANNQGMNAANGELLLLLNSDTEVHNNTIQRSIDTLKQHNAGLYSCAQFLANGEPFFHEKKSFQIGLSLKKILHKLPLFHIQYFRKLIEQPSEISNIIEVNTVSGAYMLLKKEVFLETGGFDPDYFLYSEETEWCYNRIRNNFKMIYDPKNSFLHKQGSSNNINMKLQQFISNSMGYYKRGYLIYLVYLFLIYGLLLTSNFIFYLFSKKQYKSTYYDECTFLINSLKYLLFDIPKYRNKFGARESFLLVNELK